MRIGTNPEKNKGSKITYKQHRIIIPVYIPDFNDEFYKTLIDVFKLSIHSLINTIDTNNTAITIINNNCNIKVTEYIDTLLTEKKIDKHVKMGINYGKVYTIISEAKASYEDLITLADADVLYFNNWDKEVLKIHTNFKKVGVVSPLPTPQLAFYSNFSLFADNFFKIKKGSIVVEKSFDLFEEGISNNEIFTGKRNWKKSQLYLEKNKIKACIGAGHFIATYKADILRNLPFKKPVFVFKSGDEYDFLDLPIDKMGYYRLSLTDAYVYHLGNKIPLWAKKIKFSNSKKLIMPIFNLPKSYVPFVIRKGIFRFLKNFY